MLTLDARAWSAETTLCDVSSMASSCVGFTTGGFRALADGAAAPPAAAAATTTTPVNTFSRAPSASFVVNVTGSVQLGDHEPRAVALDDRRAGEHDPFFWCTPDGQLTRRVSALSQAAALDRPLDLLGVEDRG